MLSGRPLGPHVRIRPQTCSTTRCSVRFWGLSIQSHITINEGSHLGAFDREEVDPALRRARPHQQRLAAPWRAIQQHAPRRAHAETRERLGVKQRPLHALAELLYRTCLPPNVRVPHQDCVQEERAKGRGSDRGECGDEVGQRELRSRRGRRLGLGFGLGLGLGCEPSLDGERPCFADDRAQVRAYVTVRLRRDGAEALLGDSVGCLGQQDGEDGEPRVRVGDPCKTVSKSSKLNQNTTSCVEGVQRLTYLDLPVEPSGTPQRWVDSVRAVGRGDDDDLALCAAVLAPVFHAVHECQELRDDALLDLAAGPVLAARAERVDLVEHDDARGVRAGLREHVADPRLGLAVISG